MSSRSEGGSPGGVTAAPRLVRLVFTLPVTTDKSPDEVEGLLEERGRDMVRLFESILYAQTKLEPLRFKGGPSVMPFVGRKESA